MIIFLPIVVSFGLVAVAVVVDARTGRGYGLAVLSSLLLLSALLVFTTAIIIAKTPPPSPTGPRTLGPGFLLLFYYALAAYVTAIVLIGAAIVAGIAGQWRWIVGFFVAVLAPVLLVVPPHPFVDLHIESEAQNVGLIGMLVLPQATMLAYSIKRIARPVARASARQPAALT